MRFALLGPLEVHDDNDVPLSVPGERPRVLLAALLLHANTTVSGDALAEAVWGSQDVADTAGALRSVVRRLRQALGSGPGSRITTRAPGYVISLQKTELDVPQFEEWCRRSAAAVHGQQWQDATDCAEQALRLWRGTPLMDVPSPVLYDRFGVRLEQLRLQVLEHRHEAELRLGRHEPLVPALQDAISQYPLHERFRAQLLVALARGGRQAEALTAYQDVRRLLIDELATEPGAELRDLHERILVGAPVALSGHGGEQADEPQSGTSGTPAPADGAIPRPVPRTLPAPPRLFVGRRAESDELAALVRHTREDAAGTVVISAVDGMAGVGKTALAVHVAHRVAERFPDGQLFVDLHGYTRGEAQRTSGDVLAELLQLFGCPAGQIPSDTTARAAVYRDRLAGTRTLIVLDNAADEAQVEPLLPGLGGCLVLITSRRRLKALDDAHTVSLDVLPLAQAAELFRRAVGIERVPDLRVAEEIAELCGCLPLALRIAAALLRHRSSWSADHLAQQLRAVAPGTARFVDGQRDLAAMLDLSLNALSQDAVTLFRRLGAAPGPTVDAYAAATLLENDPAGAERLLQDLVDHSLLTEPTPGRYRLHDLIRAHAYHKAAEDESEREQARTRLIRYYERAAGTASGRVARLRTEKPDEPASEHMPPLPDEPSAWAWLRSERANLEAAFDDTVARGEDEHTVALCAGLTELLRSDGPWARALSGRGRKSFGGRPEGGWCVRSPVL
jgi:DNA-binding SARP family transcriptional activator